MPLLRKFSIGLVGFFLFITGASAKNYPDVPVNYKHYQAIGFLSDHETVNGYPNGEFHPNGLINRAEAVKIMTKSLFPEEQIDQSTQWHKEANHAYVIFPDVAMGQWFDKYVETAYQEKVIHGYPDGTFKPADNINFAEGLKVILEAYKVDLSQNHYTPNKLIAVPQGEWYEKYFTYAQAHNLLNKNKAYLPAQMITRGEFADIIYRLETMLTNHLTAYQDNSSPISDEYKISIPKLGIFNVDVNFASIYDSGSALDLLKEGLGHYLNPPGQGKKMVLFGHSSGYSWDHSAYKTILRDINKLNNGDRIYINYQEKGYVYEIFNSQIIPATQDHILVTDNEKNELALYTCWPPNSVSQRYVVYGKPL